MFDLFLFGCIYIFCTAFVGVGAEQCAPSGALGRSSTAGSWNDAATWTGTVVPRAGVDISLKHAVTLNTNAIVRSLELGDGGKLSFENARTLSFCSGDAPPTPATPMMGGGMSSTPTPSSQSTPSSPSPATSMINCKDFFAPAANGKCQRHGDRMVSCNADDRACLAQHCNVTTTPATDKIAVLCAAVCDDCDGRCNDITRIEDVLCRAHTPFVNRQSGGADENELCETLCPNASPDNSDDGGEVSSSASTHQHHVSMTSASALAFSLMSLRF